MLFCTLHSIMSSIRSSFTNNICDVCNLLPHLIRRQLMTSVSTSPIQRPSLLFRRFNLLRNKLRRFSQRSGSISKDLPPNSNDIIDKKPKIGIRQEQSPNRAETIISYKKALANDYAQRNPMPSLPILERHMLR